MIVADHVADRRRFDLADRDGFGQLRRQATHRLLATRFPAPGVAARVRQGHPRPVLRPVGSQHSDGFLARQESTDRRLEPGVAAGVETLHHHRQAPQGGDSGAVSHFEHDPGPSRGGGDLGEPLRSPGLGDRAG